MKYKNYGLVKSFGLYRLNKGKRLFILASGLGVLVTSGLVNAENIEHGEWSFSLLFGIHHPKLTLLNEGLFKAPVMGYGGIIINDQTEETEAKEFRFDNTLPDSSNGGKAAFELQWHANSNHTLLFGVGSWEKTSISHQAGEMPTQGVMNNVSFERRANISYSEYSVGWRYTFLHHPDYQFYFRTSFHEMFDIDYKEDFVFNYISGSDLAGFRRIQVMEAQTASLFMGQLGIGGEWFFRKWFSLGLETGYLAGERSIQLHDAKLKSDFIARDNINFSGLPYGIISDGNLGYLSPDSTVNNPVYNRMKISFNGWQVLFRINVYY